MSDAFGNAQTTRSTPSIYHRGLAAGEISDVARLAKAAKAIEIENNGTAALTVKVTSVKADQDSLGEYSIIAVQPGSVRLFPGSVAQIWDTG